ncbi:TPA: restriction endonuclease subunit S [Photobacterium damselae]
MIIKKYAEVEESSIHWIRTRPSHWRERKLKFAVKLISQKVDAKESHLPYTGLEHIEPWTGKRLIESNFSGEGISSCYRAGDVLFGKLRPYLAKVHLAEFEGIATTEALVLRAENDLHPSFLKYFLLNKNFIDLVNGSTYGSKMPRANWDFIGNQSILLPPYDEQEEIASFLDSKTRELDRLIELKRTFVSKLKQQRISTISNVITQGIQPGVPTKESNTALLGDIPVHWSTRRLKYLSSEPMKYGANEAAELTERDLPRYIRITDVKSDGTLHEHTFRSLDESIAMPYLLQEGDILLARSGATVGKSFLYKKEWGEAAYAGYLIRFRTEPSLISYGFLYHFLNSKQYWNNINSTLIQATIQNFSAEKYANIDVPLPPLQEQKEIEDYLAVELLKIDNMVEKTNIAIEKLKEYRASLVTSAVTGLFDVNEALAEV